jgi:hypothetical protein
MRKNIKLFNPYAISSLKYANKISIERNQRTINGDTLFWGIYQYIRNHQHFDLFCNTTGLTNIEALDAYYKINIRVKIDNLEKIEEKTKTEIKLNKKLYDKIEELLKDGIHQLDFIVLFYISFFDLSIELKKFLESEKIGIKLTTTINNCKNLLNNPVVIKSGIFAFLELLDKLFMKLNLDSKNVKIMDIQNINNLHNIDEVLNSLDSEIIEE